MERKKLKPWHGIVSFVVMMVLFVLVAPPIQAKLGLFGVAITELILLVMAIAAALIFKQNLKEVFPIKLPKLREVLGVLIFWVGAIVAVYMGTAVQTLFFAEEMAEVTGGLNDVMSSEGMLFGILIVSFMPAICEEAVHRGFILHTFKDIKKPWVIVLTMGIIFGVFHWDFLRFLPTAVLGACLTWVMLKTDNMLMPALFHGTNNLLPVLASLGLQKAATSAAALTPEGEAAMLVEKLLEGGWPMYVTSIGTYLLFGLVAFPLMLAGTALMKKKGEKIKGKHVATVFIISGACFMVGIIMLVAGSMYMVSQGIISV
ncbi:MAG: CPBP family intramembrane metalloprotease [Lachnospiraceae bacterium]|nr:CPBP family intramembrane metalloprotease [Lachnospiraceae bacterium]